jgi:carbamoyl-phosphate synthase large subunit
MQNILILSAGRRVELVQAFSAELKTRHAGGLVFAADMNPAFSAACHVADGYFFVPRVTSADYTDKLIDLCLAHEIGLVVPTIDTELLPLSLEIERFAEKGIHLILSSAEIVELCRDKRKTSVLFESIGLPYPEIYARDAIRFPCFAKPFNGSCSIGADVIESPDQLTKKVLNDESLIFQELIDRSFIEYTVDAYYNRSGQLCCLVPRERLEVRAGEVSKGVTRKQQVYDFLLPRLSLLKGARGCITLQIFAKPEREQYYALEINPRFGGGYPLSYSARANYPGLLIDEYLYGKDILFFDDWEENLMMLRYDAKVLVYG